MSNNFPTYLAILMLSSIAAFSALASGSIFETTISGREYRIPAPQGMREASSRIPEIQILGEQMKLGSNTLLAMFLSEGDIGRLISNRDPAMEEFATVQVMTELISQQIPPEYFEQLANTIRDNQYTLFDMFEEDIQESVDVASKDLLQEYDIQVLLRASESVPLGVFHETDTSISFVALQRIGLSEENVMEYTAQIVSSTLLWAGGQLLYLNFYRDFQVDKDIDIARRRTRQWVNQFPTPEMPVSTEPSGNRASLHNQSKTNVPGIGGGQVFILFLLALAILWGLGLHRK